jgi:hypothetical protein
MKPGAGRTGRPAQPTRPGSSREFVDFGAFRLSCLQFLDILTLPLWTHREFESKYVFLLRLRPIAIDRSIPDG